MNNNKRKLSWFTLVEMLIVIVIIGILAAALLPRLSSARGRANDVARKADLQQTAAALISYNIDKWSYPVTAWWLSKIENELVSAGMSSIPRDPNTTRKFTGIEWCDGWWEFCYTPATKRNIEGAGFVLMAWTETEWGSNYVVATEANIIKPTTDIKNIQLCTSFTTANCTPWENTAWVCCYDPDQDQLRYIYTQ